MIAISSAYKRGLVSIEINDKRGFSELEANCAHSENMLPALEKLLDENKLSLKDNDVYSVVVGPGSFTGIRIAIALVKGLVEGDKTKKILPLTTFDLIAYSYIKNSKPQDEFTTLINGLSGFYFVCSYDKEGNKLTKEKMIDSFGFEKLENCVGLKEEGIAKVLVEPTAQELLELSKEKNKEENYISINQLTPLYLRKSQAEASLEGKK